MPDARWSTPFTELVGIDLPVVQAPIGAAATARLAAAVSEAGALGMVALSWTDPARIRATGDEVRTMTAHPFGVNVVLQWDQRARVDAALEAGVPIVSTFWGPPGPYPQLCHQAGAVHLHTVGSAEEARAAVDAGVDVVVAQGVEAGGHVWGQVATLPLVPAVVDAVDPVPVVAAGGIGDGRGLAAVLTLGASAGWLGTAFLLATESGAHPDHRQRVVQARETDTVHTELFDGGWPAAPHRTLVTATVRDWDAAGRPGPGSRPGEGEVVAEGPDGRPIRRYAMAMPATGMHGDIASLAHYAGQSAGLVRRVEPARQIVDRLVTQATVALQESRRPGG